MNLNFYNILNCNINDTQSVIKKNYYKLCKKYHPDKNNNKSSNRIKKINLAYEVLGDPDKRKKYITYKAFSRCLPIAISVAIAVVISLGRAQTPSGYY